MAESLENEIRALHRMTTGELVERFAELHSPQEQVDAIGINVLKSRDEVIARYGALFGSERLDKLTADEFRGFLRYQNNRHWEGLQRRGSDIVADMPRLRATLRYLLDESKPIESRMDIVLDGARKIPYLGRAIVTAILLVVYPDRYAVWNNKSEAGMRELGLWPEMPDATRGKIYARMNGIANEAAARLNVDLWTLDMLWWRVQGGSQPAPLQEPAPVPAAARFALEAHLHEFLVENWAKTQLGEEWDLLEEDGEVTGSHYTTGAVGEIDLLAKHKKEPRWLVVELKRDQSSDATVGQILRYMGWVRAELAKSKESVEGLIVCRGPRPKIAVRPIRADLCSLHVV